MWAPWNIGPWWATLAAVVFALAVAAALARAVGVLLRGFPARHRRRRLFLLVPAPVFAAASVWAFGPTPAALSAIVLILTLLALALIDGESGLLPDLLTQPLLWLGLLVNLNGAFVSLHDAVLGAVAGYLVLWSVYRLFLLCTGREGMGHGDFKLLAALGAWLGWATLPWVLLASSSLALAAALGLRLTGRMAAGEPLMFGPYLAAAGILVLFGVFAMA